MQRLLKNRAAMIAQGFRYCAECETIVGIFKRNDTGRLEFRPTPQHGKSDDVHYRCIAHETVAAQ